MKTNKRTNNITNIKTKYETSKTYEKIYINYIYKRNEHINNKTPNQQAHRYTNKTNK